MQNDYQIKANLMLYAFFNDYFAYGTLIYKRKDGKYKILCDGEVYYYTLHELAKEWNCLSREDQEEIFQYWLNDCERDDKPVFPDEHQLK